MRHREARPGTRRPARRVVGDLAAGGDNCSSTARLRLMQAAVNVELVLGHSSADDILRQCRRFQPTRGASRGAPGWPGRGLLRTRARRLPSSTASSGRMRQARLP